MLKLTAIDYMDYTEAQLLNEARTAFFAMDAFMLRLKGDIENDEAYVKPTVSLHLEKMLSSLYRYAVGTVRINEGFGNLITEPASFVIMVSELTDGWVSKFSPSAFYMSQTIVMAFSRFKVDKFEGRLSCIRTESMTEMFEYGFEDGLSTVELGLLARMKVQSVRNKLSTRGEFKLVKDASTYHYLPMSEAVRWLKQQSGYVVPVHGEFTEGVEVPVARDGSFFNTSLRGPKGYRIGKKGEEWVVDSFEEALIELKKMADPFWRRPSRTSGVPGIVRGVRWEKKPKSEVFKKGG